jgi:hypothetical protein
MPLAHPRAGFVVDANRMALTRLWSGPQHPRTVRVRIIVPACVFVLSSCSSRAESVCQSWTDRAIECVDGFEDSSLRTLCDDDGETGDREVEGCNEDDETLVLDAVEACVAAPSCAEFASCSVGSGQAWTERGHACLNGYR